jgi:glycosyltransferase involved in cell wall biosynthesis
MRRESVQTNQTARLRKEECGGIGMSFSVLILTRNEEKALPGCLESVAWCDDVIVLDSNSYDNTVTIAKKYGARVFFRTFDNYSAQREWARRKIAYKYPWVFSLDADERFTRELTTEVKEALSVASDTVAMFLVRRKDHFMGRWIKHSSGYPVWFERLCRPSRTHMTPRTVNEHVETDDDVCYLQQHLLHYPFSKGIEYWIERHNRYSTMEAHEYRQELGRSTVNWRSVFSRNPIERRLGIKNLACRFPLRPLLKFCYSYFWRVGFLDGKPGFSYCALQAIYEYMIDLKVDELCRDEQGSAG